MKYNFIVSCYKKLWIQEAKRLFVIEPFVYHQLKKEGEFSGYEEVVLAPCRRRSGADLAKDHDFVQVKFDKYVKILAERLNKVHKTDHSVLFWKKALALSLERYITFLHEVFGNCELYFNPEEHECRVLSERSYHIPADFDAQRAFFQHSHYGQEQIFSIYMHTFHPGKLDTKDERFEKDYIVKKPRRNLISRLLNQEVSRTTYEKAKAALLKKYYAGKPHKVGVMGSFFSARNLNILMAKSEGTIYPLQWEPRIIDEGDAGLSPDSRKCLAEPPADFDKFDLFFFASLPHCFPRIFIEHFKKVERYWLEYFQGFKEIEFVVSEAWLSNTSLCIALALWREKGVKHIYNEHNYFEHPWVGSLIPKEASLADIFASLGWQDGNIPNLVRGASLYDFKLEQNEKKLYKICYVSGAAQVKRPNYTAAYGESAENALTYLEFVRSFLENLNYSTRREILFRGYPKASTDRWLCYDFQFMLDPYLKQVMRVDDTSPSSKLLMLQSHLVIIDYISTAYLESFLMNIPTVVFFNRAAYYLGKDHQHFFDTLVAAGIFQTDPKAAANFIESIKEDPLKWWLQDHVQKAKDGFLRENMGAPGAMISFLLGLPGKNADPAGKPG